MWFQDMARSGKFVDHMWFEMAAEVLERDIVLIPLHPQNNGDLFHIISAGLLSGSGRGSNVPIFIGNCQAIVLWAWLNVIQGLSLSTANLYLMFVRILRGPSSRCWTFPVCHTYSAIETPSWLQATGRSGCSRDAQISSRFRCVNTCMNPKYLFIY